METIQSWYMHHPYARHWTYKSSKRRLNNNIIFSAFSRHLHLFSFGINKFLNITEESDPGLGLYAYHFYYFANTYMYMYMYGCLCVLFQLL